MTRRATVLVLAALACGVLSAATPELVGSATVAGYPIAVVVSRVFAVFGTAFAVAAAYHAAVSLALSSTMDKRRRHRAQSVLRLAFLVVAAIAVLGVATDRWVPALVSLGVAGVAVSLALQQPLLSLLGWVYVMTKQPYQVGDRVRIDDSKGDVIDVDYLVTTLWEVNGELVTTNQPSGRHITVPNSVVLTSHIVNFSREEFPYVWNELPVQVAYETDLEFAKTLLRETTEEYLGETMAREVERFRRQLAETPVELEVQDRPSVNVKQGESWVELRVRYLVSPKRAQRVRNDLYGRVLKAFNEHPERVKFPVSRNR
ncbi:mechanosensitive ion channel family protein [Halobacterium sp. KA-4]|uniref:mechanosensitive ion channel family protein n=1 Tax=Halobacterium sp. KA-4 TaxID=2896367 RepID=UPI001E4B026A|nr:mechanosensitive ion channel family protein [Halobacterium sp. KA-4]MCD2199214.1 mechanosensitive ion channel family protein [Halobacterium sp. KA-4]